MTALVHHRGLQSLELRLLFLSIVYNLCGYLECDWLDVGLTCMGEKLTELNGIECCYIASH